MHSPSSGPPEDNLSSATDTSLEAAGVPVESGRTPFDEPADRSKAAQAAALLGQPNSVPSGWPAVAPDIESKPVAAAGSDRSAAVGGCSTGALSLMPLLIVLALVRQIGLPVDASSIIALVTGGILLAVAVKSWPRRTMFWLGGYTAGLLAAYALVWFLVRPLVVSGIDSAPLAGDRNTVPAPSGEVNPPAP